MWIFQSFLLILSWIYYFRLGKLNEQIIISPKKTAKQFYNEILLQNRPFKIFSKQKQPLTSNIT